MDLTKGFQEDTYQVDDVPALLNDLVHLWIDPDRLTIGDEGLAQYGGYGDVFLGSLNASSQDSRAVAVKLLRASGHKTRRNRLAIRLARELKIWAGLQHPNVLKLVGYSLSPQDDVVRLILPYLSNGNVREHVQRSSIGIAGRLSLVGDVTAGLEYLHSRQPPVCHGDLKSLNILVTNTSKAVLTDFGLATAFAERDNLGSLTTSRGIKGSTRYMSPEFFLEDQWTPTLESDIWAWGCTVFEILTDAYPFPHAKSDSAVLLSIIRHDAPGQPEELLRRAPNAPKLEYATLLRILHSYLPRCWEYESRKRPPISLLRRRLSFGNDNWDSNVNAALADLDHLLISQNRLRITENRNGLGKYNDICLGTLDGMTSAPREVAVKTLRTGGITGDRLRMTKRLARELHIWARVEHPNIIPLIGYCFDENSGTPLLISPFMANGNVSAYITRTEPPIEQRLRLVRNIAAGLEYLHRSDPPICHADLKPDNVLVDLNENAVLCDFGLASLLSQSGGTSGLTTSKNLKGTTRWASAELLDGHSEDPLYRLSPVMNPLDPLSCLATTTTLKGTPRYMSPELLGDENARNSLESDVWAWACTVFQVLTGRVPYAEAAGEIQFYTAIFQKIPPGDVNLLLPKNFGAKDIDCTPTLHFLHSALPQCWDFNPHNRPSISILLSRLANAGPDMKPRNWRTPRGDVLQVRMGPSGTMEITPEGFRRVEDKQTHHDISNTAERPGGTKIQENAADGRPKGATCSRSLNTLTLCAALIVAVGATVYGALRNARSSGAEVGLSQYDHRAPFTTAERTQTPRV